MISKTAKIHPTAIIEDGAIIGNNSIVGPFSIIGKNVKMDDNVEIMSSVVIQGDTQIGEGTKVYPFTTIGLPSQDLKYKNEPTKIVIGKNNVLREHVTVHLATDPSTGGRGVTSIADNCLVMVGCHVAHDVQVGNNAIISNNVLLAGHVVLDDFVSIGGGSAVHQFARIGSYAFIGGMSGVVSNIIPYALFTGVREDGKINGANIIGLRRKGFSNEEIKAVQEAYKLILDRFVPLAESFGILESKYSEMKAVIPIISFVRDTLLDKSRSLCINS